ncbi:MAG: transcription-repair coupling factor [Rhodovibrionaceae bacterium]|nr:transcription-repair coupling factor [Rhodovibrionaceae bacterium]
MASGERVLIANAPEGHDALLLTQFARQHGTVVHVARDDTRMAQMADAVGFFAPHAETIRIPAWDCLPYDRVSPHRDIVAQRIDGLTRLMQPCAAEAGRLVLTTVSALLQRVAPREAFDGRTLVLEAGGALPTDQLSDFLQHNGYVRAETVGEAGEYAMRGGILDVFPPGAEEPLRLDFFGDELESLRRFDPLTQRTTGKLHRFVLRPVSEIVLESDSIHRFRTGYREAFGTAAPDDPLYAAISEGRPHPGMEHWMPLFYERLETLFDYLGGAPVVLDHQAAEIRDTRLETIQDFYAARRDMEGAEEAGWAYKPLPPNTLYLDSEEWSRRLQDTPGGQFSPFAAPEDAGGTVDAGGRRLRDFAEARAQGDARVYDAVETFAEAEQKAGRRVLIAGYSQGSRDRLGHLLHEHGAKKIQEVADWTEARTLPPDAVGLVTLGIERGFSTGEVTFISEQDILGERIARPQPRRRRGENFLTEVTSLGEGDFVVHVDHGIGRYDGLITLDVGGGLHDCLKVTYAGGDKLFVPVENIEVLSRFGSEDADVQLDRLGQGSWQARKARVKQRIKEIADDLIRLAAERETRHLEPIEPPAGAYDEFCARFPYPETDDQLRAIEDVLADLAEGRPMDRLICGDVGFGKTEVAQRAAFVTAMSGKQVAVVVPTTLLARQHYATFTERFRGLPVRVAQLSRLVKGKQAQQTKEDLKRGQLDIDIGTHALLSKSVAFKDLGLVIVDEEQHFGVKQKERLKQLRADVHVLTLTATPIPRTLQMALSGVREMSLIATPPVDRLAVRTFVLPYDGVVVREALLREHHRGGQSFYVCPRLRDLPELAERLEKLVPEVKVAVAHGQLPASQLEAVMTGFYERKYDVLLSTHIVESGLDVPSANTMIIHRADMFGLAQLYQLRGRIGRAKIRGYAYLTLPSGRLLSASAQKRLEVMQTLDTLGAGFTLASHDLDIRGAGNLVGEEQSGHIREVGIELYQQMLEEAVANARGDAEAAQAEAETFTPQINIGTSVMIPEAYVPDLNVRLALYRRLSTLVDRSEIEAFAAELIDRFGPIPEEVENLLQIIAIKRLCRDAGVEKVEAGPKGAVLSFHNDNFSQPGELVSFINQQAGRVQLRPDHKLVYRRQWEDPQSRVKGIRMLMDQLAKIAA